MVQSIAGAIKRQIVGQITANETTEVTIDVPGLRPDSVISLSLNTVGGTPAGHPFVSSKNVETGVVGITSFTGDTSVYDVIYLS